MNKIIILRGIPGSGKSTYARSSYSGAVIVSADDFFLRSVPGEPLRYDFDPKLLLVAHADCFKRFLVYLTERLPLVIVDNTNVHIWEWHNYKAAAELVGHQAQVISFFAETVNEIKTCWERNALTHGVPLEIIAKMAVEWEPAPGGMEKTLRVVDMHDPDLDHKRYS